MGATAAIAQGLGTAVNAGGAISSGVKGRQGQQALTQQQGQMDTQYGGMLDQSMGMLDSIMSGYGNYSNPALGGQVLNMAQGAAGGVGANNMATANALGNQGLANQAAGMLGGGYQNNVNMPGVGGQMSYNAPGMNPYDFGQVGQHATQAVQNALAMGDRARTGARENLANQTGQMQAGLDTALADRGLSRNSGAAVNAMTQHAMGAGQAMAGLDRDIMNQAQQAGLQGAQMDTQNLLGLAGMGGQYDLGMNQLGQQSALGAFQANLGAQGQHYGQGLSNAQLQAGIDQASSGYNLGAAQGLTGLQGMQNDVTMQQGAVRNAAYTDPLGIMQGVYQTNYLNPQMQGLNAMQGMAGGLMNLGATGMESGMDRRERGVNAAAGGKGTSTGAALGMGNQFGKTISGKNAPAVGGAPMSQFGVKFD